MESKDDIDMHDANNESGENDFYSGSNDDAGAMAAYADSDDHVVDYKLLTMIPMISMIFSHQQQIFIDEKDPIVTDVEGCRLPTLVYWFVRSDPNISIISKLEL
ncbi:hypothetical protein CRYUN_Cryun28dG0012900 [Craigia yunnanensis]